MGSGYLVASICHSLMSKDVEDHFVAVDHLYIFFEKYLFQSFAQFLIAWSVFLLLSYRNSLF